MRRNLQVIGLLVAISAAAVSQAEARQGAVPDPLVCAESIVQVGPHTWVIPDGDVPLVPNVGIVTGETGTLVIDPGLGSPNGETVLREAVRLNPDTDLYVASTHDHAEHSTGYLAFPPHATYISSAIQAEELRVGGAQQIQAFAGRSAYEEAP